jgi:hypothetical protein
LLVGLSFFACTSLFAAPLVVDVTGVQSNGEFGDPDNTVLTFTDAPGTASYAGSADLTALPVSLLMSCKPGSSFLHETSTRTPELAFQLGPMLAYQC